MQYMRLMFVSKLPTITAYITSAYSRTLPNIVLSTAATHVIAGCADKKIYIARLSSALYMYPRFGFAVRAPYTRTLTKHTAKKGCPTRSEGQPISFEVGLQEGTLLAGHNIKDKFVGGVHTLATNGGEVVN